ncbi:NuoM family protein [Paenibacillus yanchengensis]|uniref:NuoM family protein n=1 Tax=Paenibacillus yanchengensis TaxID=2035833 RepID=A0ABW4YNI2_9BACL
MMELQHVPILSIILFAPLFALVLLLIAQQGKWLRYIAISGSFVPLILMLWLYVDFDQNFGFQAYNESYVWAVVPLPSGEGAAVSYMLQFALAIDGLSLPMLVVVTLVAAISSLAAVQIKKRRKSFFAWFFIVQYGAIGLFMADDLLLLLLFLGVLLLAFYFLIGIWGKMNREKTATQFITIHALVYLLISSAIILLVMMTGGNQIEEGSTVSTVYSSQYIDIIRYIISERPDHSVLDVVFILLIIACLLIMPTMPLHRWFIRLFEQAAQPVTMMYVAIVSNFAVFSFIRFVILLFPQQMERYRWIIIIIGLVQLLYGAWFAFRQRHFTRLLAYLSIVQSGIVVLGLATSNELGLYGAVMQTIGYSSLMTLLLFLAGVIYERTSTLQLAALHGLARSIPFICGIMLVAVLAIVGMPGFAIFTGQLLSLSGIFATSPLLAGLTIAGVFLYAVAFIRAVITFIFGERQLQWQTIKDARLIEAFPMMIMIAFVVLLGVFPDILTGKLDQSIGVYIEHLMWDVVGGDADALR